MPVKRDNYLMYNLLLAGYLYIKIKNKRKVRSVGVREIFMKRIQHGVGHNLFEELRVGDPYMFFTYTRMNRERFEYLLSLVGPLLKKRKISTVITPVQRVAMTLRFLAAGDSQDSLSFAYRCGQSTVSYILQDTTRALVAVLKPLYVSPPACEEDWLNIASGFWNQWQFPNCLGAIDGKHFQIQAPKASQSVFFNYKKTFSIVLLAVCDANFNFTIVDIGAEGSQSDGGVFINSEFGKRLDEKSMKIPLPKLLPGTNIANPFFLVGDAAFPLKSYLMKPYGGRNISQEKAIFNYRLSRARRVIENAFGILAARWRIFRRPICSSLETTEKIIESAICLHNFIRKTGSDQLIQQYCPHNFGDRELPNGDIVHGEWRRIVAGEDGAIVAGPRLSGRHETNQASDERNTIMDFVNGTGAVPWQNYVVELRQGLILSE